MVKKTGIAVIAAGLLTLSSVAAQTTDSVGWRTSLVANFQLTQTSYSDSWTGGEAGSVNWLSNLDGTAERQLSPKVDFKSSLRLKFGQTLTQDEETKKWSKPKKSTDLIDFENVFRFTLGGAVDPYGALRLESQFYDGSVPQKKLYFSPLKLTESGGIARVFFQRGDETIVSRFGVATRQIFKRSVIDLETLETDDSTITDGGLESVTDATLKLSQNIQFVGKLSLYKALFSSESGRETPIGKTNLGVHWASVDVNWENTLTASVSKIVAVFVYTQLLYDKDVEKKVRIKETLGLGITVNLM